MARRDKTDAPDAAIADAEQTPLWLLAVTVVLCGSGVIMIEVLGSRIVGPFFGVSLYIWTALISVALIALSLGYWLGGIVADRHPVAKGLYTVIAAAVFTTLIIPLYDRELCLWASERFEIRSGVLIASLLLFLPPLTCLGFVSPYAIRLALHRVSEVGRTAGMLYALSTVGSVIGSILTGFYLVPVLGVSRTLVVIALVLAMPCVLWALVGGMPRRALTMALVTVVLSALGVWRAEARAYARTDEVRLLEERDGRYALVSVAEVRAQSNDPTSEWIRWIMIDGIPQTGVVAPDQPDVPESRWYENFTPLHEIQFHFYRLHGRQPQRALVIGLGGGAVPMAMASQGIEVDVVDIDPLVVETATEWMGFDPERVNVHIMDGRAFIRQCEETFDVIVFDVATGGGQPFHLFSREIFEETARILEPDGVMAMNYIGFAAGRRDFLSRAVFETVTETFPHAATYVYPSRRTQDTLCNIMFFFSREPMPDDHALINDPSTSGEDRRLLRRNFERLRVEFEGNGVVLTDDRNPIERHSVEINEVWRRQVFAELKRDLFRL